MKLWSEDWTSIAIRHDTRNRLRSLALPGENIHSTILRVVCGETVQTESRSAFLKKAFSNPVVRHNMSEARKKQWAKDGTHRLMRERIIEAKAGGFWYGNVVHYDTPQYCERFNDEFKERTRAFWGYRCFECGAPQNGSKLSIRHVHYDKKMCCNGSPHDVVPLCRSCHTKTNTNREYWERHFTGLLYAMHPDGKCFFTRDEMEAFEAIT